MNIATGQHQKRIRRRTRIMVLALAVWGATIAGRLFHLQILSHAKMSAEVIDQNHRIQAIVPERGTITDRWGLILAQSVPAQAVYYNPVPGEQLDEQMKPVLKVKDALKLTDEALARIAKEIREKARFVYLSRKVDSETADRIKALGASGIAFQPANLRFYPQGRLCSQVLGAVGTDDVGLGGIESKYNSVLRGANGEQIAQIDTKGQTYHFDILKEPRSGRSLELTIDATIQYFAETALGRAMAEQQAAWGTAIVSVPATGEILAMASAPDYDPNAFPPPDLETTINRAIHYLYEPGSTFKIVTGSAALEHRRVSLSQTFDCRKGVIETAGGLIRDHKSFGILTFPEALIESSNVATVMVGRQVGSGLLYQTARSFGFGEKTGIELPAEAAGVLHPPTDWSRRSLDSVSIGYEVSATALQVLGAANIIANRGLYVPPRIIKSVDGVPEKRPGRAADQAQVLSEQAAKAMAAILERVVLEGTGKEAGAAGYAFAGKTGTTQIYDKVLKSYQSARHIASFVGFAPADKPALSIIVVLAEPKKDAYYGGLVAAPVFREIAVRALRAKGIFPRTDAGRSVFAAKTGKGGRP